MANNAGVEIGKKAIVARPEDIIRAGKKVFEKEVEFVLQKFEPFVTPPVTPTPAPPPFIPFPVEIPFVPRIPPEIGIKSLILNIETLGYRPWEKRIISIGWQDPLKFDEPPKVIMSEDEGSMLNELFTIIQENKYNQMIGYGLSFDLRFIVTRAMKLGINCKEFADLEIYDLMQAMAQVKFAFIYKAQQPPKLSDIADFFWGYPKPFTDLEMMKYYKLGQLDKVVEFTSSQITRIMLLYSLFRQTTETDFSPLLSGSVSGALSVPSPDVEAISSNLTIPEANNPETITQKCRECLAESVVPNNKLLEICPICKALFEAKP